MYDVEKLVSVVCDYLDAEADYKKYSLDVRKELGLAPDSTLWIPSLNGSKAYRLGELSEKSGATGSILADICAMLDINQELLVAAVKSMQRKVATRSIELPDGKVLKADIGWTEVREEPRLGCFYQKTIGMMPRLSLSLWTPSSTPGMWCSRGLGAVVKITDNIYQKRNWNELAKFTAEWDEKRLLEEAKKHMAELQNDVVA